MSKKFLSVNFIVESEQDDLQLGTSIIEIMDSKGSLVKRVVSPQMTLEMWDEEDKVLSIEEVKDFLRTTYYDELSYFLSECDEVIDGNDLLSAFSDFIIELLDNDGIVYDFNEIRDIADEIGQEL
jgi:hypothetical protein